MPNWVFNRVYLKGTKKQITTIKALLKGLDSSEDKVENEFCFAKLVPPPAEMFMGDIGPEDFEKHPVNWFTWCPANWGTKWPACETKILEESETSITYEFQTAWAPPSPVITALGDVFHGHMEFSYWEEHVTDFAGKVVYDNGKPTKELYFEGGSGDMWDFMEIEFGISKSDYE